MTGRVCTICSSASLQDIEDALLQGSSVRQISSQYGLSKSAVSRHRHNCLAPKMAAAARLLASADEVRSEVVQAEDILTGQVLPSYGDIMTLSGLLGRLERSLDRLDGAADQTASQEAYTALAAISGQLHRGIESAARMQALNKRQEEKPSSFSINITLPGD